jgi:hypothetical protein
VPTGALLAIDIARRKNSLRHMSERRSVRLAVEPLIRLKSLQRSALRILAGGHRLIFAEIANNTAAGEELTRFFEGGSGNSQHFGVWCES